MKKWIHAAVDYTSKRGNERENELRKQWYTPEAYDDVDPERIKDLLAIEWDGVSAEDSECILYDDIDLKPIKKISYLEGDDLEYAYDKGFEGGYVFTYKDGTFKKFGWRPYPDNLDPLVEIDASSIPKRVQDIQNAKRDLMKYDKEKVDYVRECQNEIMKAISDSYFDEDDNFLEENKPVGSVLSEIKRDYLVGAIEDDLMTEDEFEDIFGLLDIIDIELAEAAI